MMTIRCFIRIAVILLLEVERFYTNTRTCYEVYNKTICYFQPIAANRHMTWDDAWTVCKENNSTLPVIENRMMAETFRRHLESKTLLRSEAWLAGREERPNVWQWLNGKRFGLISILKESQYYTDEYCTNAVMRWFKFEPRYPTNRKPYICRFTDSGLCQINTDVGLPLKNGCLFVNNSDELNLVDARSRCLDEGGDLATFEEDEDLRTLKQIRSSVLQNNTDYWIGLRLNWWIWNETDTSREIKYSNWSRYENRLNEHCLYIFLNNYTWNQNPCAREKPFLCQSVMETTSQTQRTGDANVYTAFLGTGLELYLYHLCRLLKYPIPIMRLIIYKSVHSKCHFRNKDLLLQIKNTLCCLRSHYGNGALLAIIGTIIAVVIVAVIIIALVVLRKIPRNRGMNRRSDAKTTEPHEMSVHPVEKKSVKSKAIEVDNMSNHYAAIPRVVDHDNNDECRDDPQLGILYAALEFEANKAIYDEPVMCSQQKKEASAPIKVGDSNENGQRGSSAGSPTQAAEGTIYANI